MAKTNDYPEKARFYSKNPIPASGVVGALTLLSFYIYDYKKMKPNMPFFRYVTRTMHTRVLTQGFVASVIASGAIYYMLKDPVLTSGKTINELESHVNQDQTLNNHKKVLVPYQNPDWHETISEAYIDKITKR